MAKKKLPPAIINDFEKFLETTGIPRMKNHTQNLTGDGVDYTIKVDGNDINFTCANYTPPVGCFGMDYAR